MIKSFLFSATGKDSAVLLTGAVVSTIFSFLLMALLTRNLNVAEFGLLITAFTFTQLVADFFEGGVNPALLRFLPLAQEKERLVFIKTTILLRLITSLMVGLTVFLLAGPGSALIFNNTSMIPYIRISALAIVLFLIISWGQTIFQAEKRFALAAMVTALINPLRVAGVAVILLLGYVNGVTIYWMIQSVLLIVLLLVFFRIKENFWRVRVTLRDFIKVLRFSLPVGIGFAFAAVYTKLDQLVVFNLAGQEEAGIYGLAARLIIPFILITSAINSALVPRFASLSGRAFREYFLKAVLLTAALAILIILLIPLAPWLLPSIFGSNYADAVLPFQILTLGAALFLLGSPLSSSLIYQYKKAAFSLYLSAGSLVLIWALLNFLIPLYSSSGAAAAVVAVYLLQLLVSLGYFLRLSRQ